jgi:hypothetical protein
MPSVRSTRRVAVALASFALVAGTVATPASAAATDEAQYLSFMKQQWNRSSQSDQDTTCKGYRTAPALVIASSVSQVWQKPATHRNMTKAAWKRVISKYLRWACAGPGTTPRG